MSLWKIAWRSIQQRALASSLTGLSMALGVALVVAVLVAHGIISNSFMTGSGLGYDVIVGADKGGKLQLVLNTVYYLSRPVENIPYSFYKEFTEGKYKDYVAKAVPVCLGDYYEQYRVVGTTPAFFNSLEYGGHKKFEFSEGHNFKRHEYFSGVVGSTVAKTLNLHVGSEFTPTHNVPGEADHHHDPFKIVGVLKPTGTPNDRALFVNMEGFYLTGDHGKPVPKDASAKEGTADKAAPPEAKHDHAGHDHVHSHEPLPESQREVTAVLILTGMKGQPGMDGMLGAELTNAINEGTQGQAVSPILEITTMFKLFVDPIQYLLLGLTVLIVIVAGIGILVSIYNSMSERQHDIAVMRALGAGRGTVMSIVLLEAILLSLAGGLAGWALGHLLLAGLSPLIAERTGVGIGIFHFVWLESVIIPGLIALAAVVGFVPALVAYRTDVAKALSAAP